MAEIISLEEYKENKSPHLVIDMTATYNDGITHASVCPVEMFKNWAQGKLKELDDEEKASFEMLTRYIVKDWLIRILDEEGKLNDHPDLLS